MILYFGTRIWPVGETVNTPAFHAGMHGFEPRTGHHLFYFGGLAQLGEHLPDLQKVGGSSPSSFTNYFSFLINLNCPVSSVGRAFDF